jgi:hypothetical protein
MARQAETDAYREVLAAVINGVLTWERWKEERDEMHEWHKSEFLSTGESSSGLFNSPKYKFFNYNVYNSL